MWCFMYLLSISLIGASSIEIELTESRLSKSIKPVQYIIDLLIDTNYLDTETFTGNVTIEIEPLESNITEVRFNSRVKSIISLELEDEAGKSIQIMKTNFNEFSEIVTLTIKEGLIKINNKYFIKMFYMGDIQTHSNGFFKSTYVEDGKMKYVLATNFKPKHARRAFPCFDEPHFQANFTLSLTYPNYMTTVLSNTDPDTNFKPTEKGSLTTIKFKTTPKMSPYLLGFVISEFTCSSSFENNLYRVCSRKNFAYARALANNNTQKIMSYLENLFNKTYKEDGIAKIDFIAMPDFVPNMVENWGLIMARESSVLYDELSTYVDQQHIIRSIIHVFVLHWYGNIVTLETWEDFWFNEILARYLEFYVASQLYPDWQMNESFYFKEIRTVLNNDIAPYNNLLIPEKKSIDTALVKGASVIYMIANIVGKEEFATILRNYINVRANSVSKVTDVLEFWSQHINIWFGVSFNNFSNNWFFTQGYPIITASAVSDNLLLNQRRFLLEDSPDNAQWYVPVSITKSNDVTKFQNTTAEFILKPCDSLLIPNYLVGVDWIILNNQASGLFRVNYDHRLWINISNALNKPSFSEIPVINRMAIIDDVLNIAKAGRTNYATAFNLLTYLENEQEYYPWKTAFDTFSFILERFSGNDIGDLFHEYVLTLTRNVSEKVAFDNENKNDLTFSEQQSDALGWLCKYEEKKCIQDAKSRFEAFKADPTQELSANLKLVIFCTGLRFSTNATDYDFVWDRYKNPEGSVSEKTPLIIALGCTRNTTLVTRYLDAVFETNSTIKQQDAMMVFISLLEGNKENIDIVLDYIREYYSIIETYFDKFQPNALSQIFLKTGKKLFNQSQVVKFYQLVDSIVDAKYKLAGLVALEDAKRNILWSQNYEKTFYSYLELFVSHVDEENNNLLSKTTTLISDFYVVFGLSISVLFFSQVLK